MHFLSIRIRDAPCPRAQLPLPRLVQEPREGRALRGNQLDAALRELVETRRVHVVVVDAVGGRAVVVPVVGAGAAVHEAEDDEADVEDVRVDGDGSADFVVVGFFGLLAAELELFLVSQYMRMDSYRKRGGKVELTGGLHPSVPFNASR